MWPEIDMTMRKLDDIRDILRIAYNAEGENRARLFETGHAMVLELADHLKAKAPEVLEDED